MKRAQIYPLQGCFFGNMFFLVLYDPIKVSRQLVCFHHKMHMGLFFMTCCSSTNKGGGLLGRTHCNRGYRGKVVGLTIETLRGLGDGVGLGARARSRARAYWVWSYISYKKTR